MILRVGIIRSSKIAFKPYDNALLRAKLQVDPHLA
jgi:hypothetical protein